MIQKTKNITAFFATFLFAVLLVSSVSALSISGGSELSVSNNKTIFTLLNDDGATQDVSLSINNIISDGSTKVVLDVSPDMVSSLSDSSSFDFTVLARTISSSLEFGRYSATLTAKGVNASDTSQEIDEATATISFVKGFCSNGERGDLEITQVDIESDGDDDEEWSLLDTIKIEVDVDNDGDDDIDDVFVELGLFDSSGDNLIDDLEFENADEEEIDVGRIRDGDEETVTFEFKVPADFEDGDYKLTVKAYSDDAGEDEICADSSNDLNNNDIYQDIEIIREDDEGKFITFDNVEFNPQQATCSEEVVMTFDVVNIGDEDQDQVRVTISNRELGLDLSKEIRNDLDQGDSEELSFNFIIPADAVDKSYAIEIDAEYDFRRDIYRESLDDPEFEAVTVLGCSASPSTPSTPGSSTRFATISATLDSDANAGEEIVVRSVISNIGSEARTLIISATGHESWADLDSISERIITLNPTQSREVIFTFTADEEAEGQESFNIVVQSGDDILTREVSLDISGADSGSSGLGLNFGDNTIIWIIGILNVVLIILIIVVAVRIASR